MKYNLYIDDIRNPPDGDWKIVRTSKEAIEFVVENGIPEFISFDHDLGGDDTSMVFVKKWVDLFPETPFPKFRIHSANPIGSENLRSYIKSFNRSLEM